VDTILEKSESLVADLVTRQGAKGRRTYNAAAKQALGELCRRPGVSVSRLALTHGVNANLLRRWAAQYSPTSKIAVSPTAVVQEQAALVPVRTCINAGASSTADNPDPFVEIIFESVTVRVHGAVDPAMLKAILDCLVHRP
jgi:transposase